MDVSYEPLDPIPFTERLLTLALQLKQIGLPWVPHAGCFVWDHKGVVTAPSPFPRNVYFILSMKRFLGIFGEAEQMQRQLVWLPTWYQAMQLCQRLGIPASQSDSKPSTGEETLIALYRLMLKQLTAAGTAENSDLLSAVQEKDQA
ncbi:MAG: hypothetical protein WBG37_14140 [Desulfobacterales bacterium]